MDRHRLSSEAAWHSLCKVAGFDEVLTDNSLGSAAQRRMRETELDQMITHWTQSQEETQLQSRLIEAGIAAHVVQNSPECIEDPQLKHRNHFITVPHISAGDFVVEGTRFKLSRTPGRTLSANPELGEHNVHVLMEILGYDADKMADVFASLAME